MHLAADESGAIAAFLDDATTRLLQVSVAKGGSGGQLQLRLANAADFPPGCSYQVGGDERAHKRCRRPIAWLCLR